MTRLLQGPMHPLLHHLAFKLMTNTCPPPHQRCSHHWQHATETVNLIVRTVWVTLTCMQQQQAARQACSIQGQ